MSNAGVHRPLKTGVAGKANEGAFSLVLAGNFSEDVDNGDSIIFTGRKDGGRRKLTSADTLVADQELSGTNLALALNCNCEEINEERGGDAGTGWKNGKPVRVCRGAKNRQYSNFGPVEGFR